MRRNRLIASSLAVAVLYVVSACTDLLTEDPKGFTTTDSFYKTGADLNSATIAIYNALRGMQGQAQWTTPELASDQARADNREPNLGTSGPDFLRSEEHTSELQSQSNLVCRLLLEKKHHSVKLRSYVRLPTHDCT